MVVLQRVEDMNYANLLNIFGYAKEYEVVADRISAVAYPSENGITAEFMRGGHLFKQGDITTLYMQSRPHFRKRLPCIESATSIYFCLGSGD